MTPGRGGRVGRLDDLASTVVAALTIGVALLAWTPFVEDRDGLVLQVAGVLAVVGLSGWVLRALGTPWVVVPCGQLAALLVWATGQWVPEAALAGWVPTVESVTALVDEVRAGVTAAQQYSAPVAADVTELAVLLTLAAAACGLLVDLFVCTWRVVPPAGLPLLLVYTVPAGLIGAAVPWWVFALSAVGFLFLIARDHSRRVRQWGHAVRTTDGARPGLAAPAIGVLTVSVALLAPTVVPVVAGGLPSGVIGGGGGNTVEISNPMIDLRRDLNRGQDLDLVRFTTDDPDPSYLRLAVLDEYDGDAWRPLERQIPAEQRVSGALPRPSGLSQSVPTQERQMSLTTSPSFDSVWLPLPYPASAARIDGDWRYDRATLDVVSAQKDQTTRALQYTARTLEIDYDPVAMDDAAAPRRAVTDRYLQLPDDLPDVVAAYAEEAVGDADTHWQQAVRLQNWFQDPARFAYSLERAPASAEGEDLEQFLRPGPDGRVGYCEQFAASMALMARTLGIPSRVAVGFLRPESTGPRSWTYSAHDMHAWPEIFLEGHGWVRFEPTPTSHTTAVPAYTRSADSPAPDVPEPQPSAAPTQPAAPTAAPDVPQATDVPDASDTASDDTGTGWVAWTALVVLVLAGAAITPRTLRRARATRRRRAAGDDRRLAEAAWAEIRDLAIDTRQPWHIGESPRVAGRRLAGVLHDPEADPRASPHPDGSAGAAAAAAALGRVVHAVERARYSPAAVDGSGLVDDVDRVRVALLAQAGPRRARQARWLPRSLWRVEARDGDRDGRRDESSVQDDDLLEPAGASRTDG